MIFRWNTINPNEKPALLVTEQAHEALANERPALSLTPLAKIELDATWLEDASARAGLVDFSWMG